MMANGTNGFEKYVVSGCMTVYSNKLLAAFLQDGHFNLEAMLVKWMILLHIGEMVDFEQMGALIWSVYSALHFHNRIQ